jgi:cytochrome c-type biogenesis protein CcmF
MEQFNDGNWMVGKLGHLFVIISFIAAIVATFTYYKATVATSVAEQSSWKKLARIAVYSEFLAIVGIVVCLYFILYNHMYQYKFAYKHSDNSLPIKYLFSCFWEGQEGSFLVWIFWHSVLSLFVMHSAKEWEAPVMAVINFVQIFLCAFLLGIYFGDFHIGSSPFVLLRHSDMGIGPIFQQFDYLSKIKDGNGLNITLQDPWMVIHPPTLFFGYASCTIPMAFAVAALWKKNYDGWVKPALPWTINAASVLGVGILMGAKWAYQSLSFGGYWAWDPVENASLVPWLVLIAGMHTMLIYRHTQYSLRATFIFIILTFVFVIYSTCLTRTGILGETSVHAFTGGGLKEQIWLLLAFVGIPPFIFIALNYKKIPTIRKEEATWSREFWMFIGALVFFLSGVFVIVATSLPVFNYLFGLHFALGEKSQVIYNQVHIPIVIIVAFVIGLTQYLKYKNTPKKYITQKLWIPIIISILLTLAFISTGGITYAKQGDLFKWLITLALAAAIFTVIANAAYIVQVVKSKFTNWGSSLAHLGFGLLLVGILISASNQKIASINNPMVNVFGEESKEDPRENLNLIKGLKTTMGEYAVLFEKDEKDNSSKQEKQYYTVNFTDTITNKTFTITPSAYTNIMNQGKQSIQANPDFKSYWDKDVFLYITSLVDPAKRNLPPEFEQKTLVMGDTSFYRDGYFILKRDSILSIAKGKTTSDEMGFAIEVEVIQTNGKRFKAYPIYKVKNSIAEIIVDSVPEANLVFRIDGVEDNKKVRFSVMDKNKLSDYITIKVLEFPQIKLMWIGIIIMSIGFMLSMVKRIKQLKVGTPYKN